MCPLLVAPSFQHPVLAKLKSLLRGHEGFRDPVIALYDRAEEQCANLAPELVMMVLSPEQPDRCLEVLQRLRKLKAGHILVIGPGTDPKLILRSLQAGAEHYIDQTELESELEAGLTRLHFQHGPAKGSRRLIAVLSASGGCGASTVAVNLAAVIARDQGRCHLIDLHTGKADLAALLDLVPQYTLSDLCRNEARLDKSLYEKLLERHSSGICLLSAPRDFGDAAYCTAQGVEQALSMAQEIFADIIVDLEDCFHEEQVLAIQLASEIVLVSRLDFISIRNTRRILDHLGNMNVPRQRIKLAINQYGHPDDLPVAEAEEAIGLKPTTFIPHDPKVICSANNSGIPAAFKQPTSLAVNAIASLVGLERKGDPNSGLLPKLRSYFRAQVVAWSVSGAVLGSEARS